MIQDKKGEGPR